MLPLSPSRARQGGPLPTLDDLLGDLVDAPRSAAWGLPRSCQQPAWELPASWLPTGEHRPSNAALLWTSCHATAGCCQHGCMDARGGSWSVWLHARVRGSSPRLDSHAARGQDSQRTMDVAHAAASAQLPSLRHVLSLPVAVVGFPSQEQAMPGIQDGGACAGLSDLAYNTTSEGQQLEQAFSISPKAAPEGSDLFSAPASQGPHLEITPLSIDQGYQGPWGRS